MKFFNQLLIALVLMLVVVMLPGITGAQTLTDYSSNSRRPAPRTTSAYSNHPNPGGNPDVPIDGGISFLIAAGAAYGAAKMRATKKAKQHKPGETA
jgi:hypothetical protein